MESHILYFDAATVILFVKSPNNYMAITALKHPARKFGKYMYKNIKKSYFQHNV